MPPDLRSMWPPARPVGCLSDLALDRHRAGELDAGPHLAECNACQQRLEALRAPAPWSADERAAIVDRIDARARSSTRRAWSRRAGGLALAAGVILAMRALLPAEPDRVQLKGALALDVYRERDGVVSKQAGGAVLRSGDRLRFAVDVPNEGYLRIVGVESAGRVYACLPGDARAAPIHVKPAGRAELLDGAVRLDDSTGPERIVAVLCREAFTTDALAASEEGVSAPAGCRSVTFAFEKAP